MHKKSYLQLVLLSLTVNLLWAFLSTQLEYLFSPDRENPEGLITGLGFILCYAFTFLVFIPRSKRTLATFFVLTFTFGAIFLIATFVIPMFFINSDFGNEEYIFFFFSSLLASVAVILVLRYSFLMKNILLTMLLTTTSAFIAILLFFSYLPIDKFLGDNFKRIVHPIALGYCIWQVLTTITIGQSLILKKPAHNRTVLRHGG